MTDLKFLTVRDKDKIGVAIPKTELTKHKGVSGLKYFLILAYLRKHLQTFGEVSLSLHYLASECGYSTNTHNLSAYNDFRKILKSEIIDKEFASTDADILSVGAKTQFSIHMSENNNLFYSSDNYVLFTVAEYEKITASSTKVNKSVLAGTYLYIKQHILADSDTNEWFSKIAYPSKQRIMKGIGVTSTTTVESAIKALIDIGIVFTRNDLYVEDKNNADTFIPARIIFALNHKNLDVSHCISELSSFYDRTVLHKNDVPISNRKFI